MCNPALPKVTHCNISQTYRKGKTCDYCGVALAAPLQDSQKEMTAKQVPAEAGKPTIGARA
ncbi:hypothetical protein H0W91_01310 [Patescibacteria group bacterium]|nr:hypothetical protein [Patescibacteria group bacterium]